MCQRQKRVMPLVSSSGEILVLWKVVWLGCFSLVSADPS